jgi:hypothetical protein
MESAESYPRGKRKNAPSEKDENIILRRLHPFLARDPLL